MKTLSEAVNVQFFKGSKTWMTMLIFILTLTLYSNLFSQDINLNVRRISMEDGLPDNNIQCVIKDDLGYMWIGTDNGLARYEGNTFTIFNRANLDNIDIDALYKDKNGNIWASALKENFYANQFLPISAFLSINIINPYTLKVFSFAEYIKKDSIDLDVGSIIRIFNIDGELWITTFDGRYFYFSDKLYSYEVPAPQKEYDLIIKISGQQYWCINDQRVDLQSVDGDIIKTYQYPPKSEVTNVWLDQNSSLLLTFKIHDSELARYYTLIDLLPHNITIEHTHQKSEAFYYRSQYPPIQQDKNTTQLQRIMGETVITNGRDTLFSSTQFSTQRQITIKDIYISDDHNYWAITEDGLYLISKTENKFKANMNTYFDKLSTRGIIKVDSTSFLLNTYQGLLKWDPTSTDPPIQTDGITYGMSFLQENDSIIWAAHASAYIVRYEYPSLRFQLYHIPIKIVGQSTNCLYKEDITNKLLVGSTKGLYYLDEIDSTLLPYPKADMAEGLAEAEVSMFYKNEKGLWIVTSNGLYLKDSLNNIVLEYPPITASKKIHIRHLYEDAEGKFWLSTNGNGLVVWDPSTNADINYTIEDGLAHENVHAVFPDKNDNYWIPTDNGLAKYNLNTGEFITYKVEDGLAHNEFNWGSHYQDTDGTLILGGVNGVTTFNPNAKDFGEANIPNLMINSIETIERGNYDFTKYFPAKDKKLKLCLSNKVTFVKVNYTIDNFSDPTKNNYAYKIEGLGDKWQYTNNSTLSFGRLDYGEYVVNIKGKGPTGNWSLVNSNIRLVFEKPLYKRTWFLLLLTLGMMILTYAAIRYRSRYLLKRNKILRSEITKRTRELRASNDAKNKLFAIIAHDLRGPILSFSNLSSKVKFLVDKGEWKTLEQMGSQIEQKTTHLSKMLNNIIPWAKAHMKTSKEDLEPFNLYNTISYLQSELKQTYQYRSQRIINRVDKKAVVLGNKDSLTIAFRNILSNAIKYSDEPVTIESSSSTSEQIVITIIDQGEGMSEDQIDNIWTVGEVLDQESKGIGLLLARDLILDNLGRVEIESQKGSGTKVIITLNKQ